jgi:flagellar biosynthesis/type III secretory pathway M-ring protein FliF/YscJ
MFRPLLALVLLISLLGCTSSTRDKQKVTSSEQSQGSQQSSNNPLTPNPPPADPTKQNDKHTENLTKPAPHTPTPQGGSDSTGQSSSTETHKSN